MILIGLAMHSNSHCLEKAKTDFSGISDLDLCTARYMEGVQTKSFYEGKEEARASQLNDSKLENIILKVLLVYLVVR